MSRGHRLTKRPQVIWQADHADKATSTQLAHGNESLVKSETYMKLTLADEQLAHVGAITCDKRCEANFFDRELTKVLEFQILAR